MSKLEPVLIETNKLETRDLKDYMVVVDTDRFQDLHLTISENDSGQLIVFVKGNHDFNLYIAAKPHSNYSILWIYDETHEYKVNESIELFEGAHLLYYIAELSHQNVIRKSAVKLTGRHSNFHLRSASVVSGIVDWNQQIIHHAPHTYAHVQNYGMVYSGAQYLLDVQSHILKGMKKSETHQQNRIMNMDDKPRARVFPQLIIDENDVKASHAATVGQPDPNEIYYLQSRGLDIKTVIRLLSLGYVMPVLEHIKDEAIFNSLAELFESKVLIHD